MMRIPRRSAALAIAPLLVLTATHCLAQIERVTISPTPPQTHTVRLLVFCVDFVGSTNEHKPPVHTAWQTPAFISNAIFGTDPNATAASPPAGDGTHFRPLPTGTRGQRLGSCSIAEYVSHNVPGTRLAGQVFRFPASTNVSSDGWYRLSITDAQAERFFNSDDAGWAECCRAVLTAAGYGDNVNSPSFMRAENGGYQAAYIIHGGDGGSVRWPFGWPLASSGLGNNPTDPHNADGDRRYGWLGTACHEVMHWAADCGTDMYGHVMQSYNSWEILSSGNSLGAFPAPATAWFHIMKGLARTEDRLSKGPSARVVLPRPSSSAPVEMAVLDNSSVGDGDQLVVEYRDVSAADPGGHIDSAGMGLPVGTRPGLLVMDYDRFARGFFHSDPNVNGGLPASFQDATLGRSVNAYPLAPIADIRRADGTVGSETGDLYTAGSTCAGSYYADPILQPKKSSANRDGDVLWELHNLRGEGTGFGFDAQFQGRPLTTDVTAAAARWRSGVGPVRPTVAGAPSPNGSVFAQSVLWALDGKRYHDVLWVTMPGAGAATSASYAEAAFPHLVAGTGERLTGRVMFGDGRTQVPTGQARVRLTWTPVTGAAVRLLDGTFRGAPELPEFSVDLSPMAGASGQLTLRVDAAPGVAVGLASAYFYRKAEAVLYDLVQHASDVRPLSPPVSLNTNVTDPDGAVGLANNVRLVDRVLYGQALFTKPQTVDRGTLVMKWPAVHIPDSGAVLRGSVGYPVEAIGGPVQHGALVRVAVWDGVHRIPLREWPTPLVAPSDTMISTGGTPDSQGRPTVRATPQDHWRDGLAWGGETWRTWCGDWMRTGDFDGDGRDDIAVFTGGSTAKVGVCLSRAGTAQFRPWHEWFAPEGEYPLVGRLNNDNRDDIVTFTPTGDVYGAVARGEAFDGIGQRYAERLLRATEIPALGDVDGDGYDDVILFDRDNVRGLGAGVVLVARNNHAGRFEAPRVAYSGNFCGGWRVPLVGDLNGDHHADIVCVDLATGQVYAALQQGAGFGAARVWLRSAELRFAVPTAPRAIPTSGIHVGGSGPFPGPEPLSGFIPFLAETRNGTSLIWFNRSCYTDTRKGKVYVAKAIAGGATAAGAERFTDPAILHSYFCIDEEWPLVGDFDNDGAADIVTTVPGYYTVWAKWIPWIFYARQPEEPRPTEFKWPGDLYVSAKPASVYIPNIPPRVHRFAIDLAEFRGKDISVEVSVDGGPPCPNDDLLYWPDLKLYQRPTVTMVASTNTSPAQAVVNNSTTTGGTAGGQTGGNAPGTVQPAPGNNGGQPLVPQVVRVTDRSVTVRAVIPTKGKGAECLFTVLDASGKPVAQSTLQELKAGDQQATLEATIGGLTPGTVYLVRLEGIVAGDKVVTDPEKFATTAAAQKGEKTDPIKAGEQQPKPTDQPPARQTAETKRWRLEVLGVTRAQEYVERYCADKKTVSAQEKDQTLLVINCRLVNLLKEAQVPVLSERLCGHTGLVDAGGNVLAPADFDAVQESNKWQSYASLPVKPGGAVEFALVFRVAAKLDPRVLVFTFLNYPQDVGNPGTDTKLQLP